MAKLVDAFFFLPFKKNYTCITLTTVCDEGRVETAGERVEG
jgi:hypothetical protein